MTSSNSKNTHRYARSGSILAFVMLVGAACEMESREAATTSGPTNTGGGGSSVPLVTGSVYANTEMTATIIDNSNTNSPNNRNTSLAQGSALENASLMVTNNVGDMARGSFQLNSSASGVVFTIQDEAISNGVNRIAGVGKNQTPNNHQAMLTLFCQEPVTGTLAVELSGSATSLAGSGFTTIDVGNNGAPDFQSPFLQGSWQQTLTFDGAFEIRTETVTQVENGNEINRSITVSFTPTGSPGDFASGGQSQAFPAEVVVANDAEARRSETARASIPFPRGAYQVDDLAGMSIRGRQTAWMPMQNWPDGSVKVAQAQFTDTWGPGETKRYTVDPRTAAVTGPFVRNRCVEHFSPDFNFGAEVRDTFCVPYRSFANGVGEVLQTSALVETRRYRTYHRAAPGEGIGRDYLTSTYYVTEFRDQPYVLIDWVLGNDYLGADEPGESSDPNLYALGDADVCAAYFLCRGAAQCFPYRGEQEQVEAAVPMSGGYDGLRVMRDTYIADGQTRRYRFVALFASAELDPAAERVAYDSACAASALPLCPFVSQQTWQETAAAGLVGGPVAGPANAGSLAADEYAAWDSAQWFGVWGARGDSPAPLDGDGSRGLPLSPELAHALQGEQPRLLQKLEQKAWAQAMRPRHRYGLNVSDARLVAPVSDASLSGDIGDHLGRLALRNRDPYPAYRSLSAGRPAAHGWSAFSPAHRSATLLFDYWTISGDAWAREELRQLGQAIKAAMHLGDHGSRPVHTAAVEGWRMQALAQVYQATRDHDIEVCARGRARAVVDAERRVGHPSRALMVHVADQSATYPEGYEVFMPWQHGAVLYGFLGASRCFEDPLLLEVAENVATTVEYSWVSATRHPSLGWVANGVRYRVPAAHRGSFVRAEHLDHLPGGADLGASPLGGRHRALLGGLHLLALSTCDPVVRAKALNYGGMLMGEVSDSARWDEWVYCTPAQYIVR